MLSRLRFYLGPKGVLPDLNMLECKIKIMIPLQSHQFVISGVIQIRTGRDDSKAMPTYNLDSNFNNIEHEL